MGPAPGAVFPLSGKRNGLLLGFSRHGGVFPAGRESLHQRNIVVFITAASPIMVGCGGSESGRAPNMAFKTGGWKMSTLAEIK
jgi:hypothetical protein